MKCPECGSEKVVKFGFYILRKPKLVRRQRYQCQNCGRSFSEEASP